MPLAAGCGHKGRFSGLQRDRDRSKYTRLFARKPHGNFDAGYIESELVRGETVPNLVVSRLNPGGQISVFDSVGGTELIADVQGWFPSLAEFVAVTPARLLDTRAGSTTVDRSSSGVGALRGQRMLDLRNGGRGDIPSRGVNAVVLNITATQPTANAFVTVWTSGTPRPNTSNLKAVAGQTISDLVIAKIGSANNVLLFNSAGSTDIVVDIVGWFP